MMKYTLVAKLRKEKEISVRNVRVLDSTEFELISNSVNHLFSFRYSQSLYDICKRNYEDLTGYWKYAREEEIKTGRWIAETTNSEIIPEINRRLINYLSSFRSFLDHLELKFKHIDSDTKHLSNFKNKTAYYYDHTFSYRFLYKLRNYVQHCGLPVGGCEFSASADMQDGSSLYKSSVYLNRDLLLANKSFTWGKSLEKEIKNQPERIGIMFHVTSLEDCIREINKLSVEMDLVKVNDPWKVLYERYVEVKSKFSDFYPAVLVSDDESFQIGLNQEKVSFLDFPLQTMHLIQTLKESIMN